MIIDMFKRSGKKREKEKWASSSETAFPFEKRPLLAGKFCLFSLPPPTPYSFSFSLFFAPSSPSWPRLLKRWITLSTEKRKCFSLILTYPLDSAIQRLNIPGLNAWIRPPQPLVQEVFFAFSLRVSVETHLRLFWGKEDLTEKTKINYQPFPRVEYFPGSTFGTKEKGHIKQINKNFVLKTCLCLFTKLLFNAYTISVLLYINKSLKSLDRKQKFTSTRRILNS